MHVFGFFFDFGTTVWAVTLLIINYLQGNILRKNICSLRHDVYHSKKFKIYLCIFISL